MTNESVPPAPQCYRHAGRESYIRCQRCERPICPDCMREASVGFQCPECVSEGAKTVRQAKTRYGGALNTGFSVSLVIVAINVVIWLAIQLTGGETSRIVDWLGLVPQSLCAVPGGYIPGADASFCAAYGDTWLTGIADGGLWRMVTSVFTQVSFLHLFFNVFNVYILGPQLETVLGRARFTALYLLSGIAGSVAVYVLGPETGMTIGASGAVFGLLGATLVLVLKTKQPPQGMLLWVGLSVVYSFVVPGISWQAHLGGLIAGALITAAFVWAPRGPRQAQLQWAAVVVLSVVLVAATAARTLVLT